VRIVGQGERDSDAEDVLSLGSKNPILPQRAKVPSSGKANKKPLILVLIHVLFFVTVCARCEASYLKRLIYLP
jgi:hypothetical protein